MAGAGGGTDAGAGAGAGPVDDPLDEPLAKGVLRGKAAQRLHEVFGMVTVGDLLRTYPRRYQHWGALTPVAQLRPGEDVTILAEVASVSTRRMQRRRGQVTTVRVTDGSDDLELAFFNVPYVNGVVRPGRRLLFSGKVGVYAGRRQLSHPRLIPLEEDDEESALARIDEPLPIYRAAKDLDTMKIRKAVETVLGVLGEVPDPVPPDIRARQGVMSLTEALRGVHRPKDDAQWRAAHRRLRFEEAFVLQVALARRRAGERGAVAVARVPRPGGLLDAFDARLPFRLTAGQEEVGRQIAADLATPHPMHRLLQGEVGSGKTLVALRAMLAVVDAGGQAALLAPTEVLAAQHHRSICALLGPLAQGGMLGGDEQGTRVVLLTGSVTAASRRRVLLDAVSGDAGIVIGTHALLQDAVEFGDLGLVVVDEQHRFGVEQRDALRGKGRGGTPHLLVMTATPIPRTVAMTVFGDLETSTLRELPAGRSPITTHVVLADRRSWYERTWARVAEEVAAGHQVYVVCPRIGGDEAPDDLPDPGFDDRRDDDDDGPDDDTDVAANPGPSARGPRDRGPAAGVGPGEDAPVPLRSVLEMVEELRADPVLAGVRIGVLHGRLPAEERDTTMRAFADGRLDLLVATTVIEVGVDVPNATMMVVMDADRFGVSQLHQLRGRVGRGRDPGLCLLMGRERDGAPPERLVAVAGTLDGFELATVDLRLRREGDVLGARQSGGRSSLKLLRVLEHEDVITAARHEATALVAQDPELRAHPRLAKALAGLLDDDREAYLERG